MQKTEEMMQIISFQNFFISLQSIWCDGRAVRHRSAKPGTAVRFRFAPQKARREPFWLFSVLALRAIFFIRGAAPNVPCGSRP